MLRETHRRLHTCSATGAVESRADVIGPCSLMPSRKPGSCVRERWFSEVFAVFAERQSSTRADATLRLRCPSQRPDGRRGAAQGLRWSARLNVFIHWEKLTDDLREPFRDARIFLSRSSLAMDTRRPRSSAYATTVLSISSAGTPPVRGSRRWAIRCPTAGWTCPPRPPRRSAGPSSPSCSTKEAFGEARGHLRPKQRSGRAPRADRARQGSRRAIGGRCETRRRSAGAGEDPVAEGDGGDPLRRRLGRARSSSLRCCSQAYRRT